MVWIAVRKWGIIVFAVTANCPNLQKNDKTPQKRAKI